MVFVATDKMPGVYIDEIQLPGPIPGIATNNVAIIGPAEKGPTNQPVLVTNPTQFAETFGGHLTDPQIFFASHAAQGFFANGGTKCYFVRVGAGRRPFLELKDKASKVTLVVTAKLDGVTGPKVSVNEISGTAIKTFLLASPLTLAGTGASGKEATVAAAGDLRPGDSVTLTEGGNSERANVVRVEDEKIVFKEDLTHSYAAGGTIDIADLIVQQRRIRLESVAGLEPGTYVKIESGATNERHVIGFVDKANSAIVLEKGLSNNYSPAATNSVEIMPLAFTLTVGVEKFASLSMDPRHSRYFAKQVQSDVFDLTLPDPPNATVAPDDFPADLTEIPLAGGADDDRNYSSQHFKDGIKALEIVDEVNMVCMPDNVDAAVQAHLIAHCETMQDRFAILDCPAGLKEAEIRVHRDKLQSDRGYGALYYPRIKIRDPNPHYERLITVPASGHIAGVYARTDEQKGVHKVPANEVIKGVVELERTLTCTDAGILNEQSINVLQFFRGRGFRIWGGRTLATSTQWRFINVRRLMLFIEESVQEACEAFVFDPNNLSLWETIKRQVSGFLTQVWQTGALFGATPKKAFRVRIDEELNPPETRALGQLHIEVIVFPTTPAEFIVFRVIQEPGGPRLVEI
jgi:hypothetical protein